MIKNVIIAGVGGQGTIFAGKILGTMAYQTGLHVKISEIHGMSQRGGSVVTQVRFGKHVYAPLAQAGEVDCLGRTGSPAVRIIFKRKWNFADV